VAALAATVGAEQPFERGHGLQQLLLLRLGQAGQQACRASSFERVPVMSLRCLKLPSRRLR
jgi:hypothetical protein